MGSENGLVLRLEQRLAVHRAVADVLTNAREMSDGALGLVAALAPIGAWTFGALWTVGARGDALRCAGTWSSGNERVDHLAAASRTQAFKSGEGLPGRVWAGKRASWIEDISKDANFPRADAATAAGLRCALAFPIVLGGQVRGVLELLGPQPRSEDQDFLGVLDEIGAQLGQFIERKRAEEAQRVSDMRKSAVLEAALDAIITIDSKGRIVEWNPAAERIFGRQREDVLGKEMSSLILPPELRTAHEEGLARYLDTGQDRILRRRIEMTAIRSDGSVFPVELTVTPIAIEGLEPMFTGYVRDIAERKDQELELRRRAEALTEQHRQKDAFLAMLAHELRNPLAPIRSALDIMAMLDTRNPTLQNAREVIDRQVHALTRLVDDLLDVSRITRGVIELRRERVGLADILNRAIESSTPAINSRGHKLEVRVPAEDIALDADPTRLIQVVSNLLNNAAKYTSDGGCIWLTGMREADSAVVRVRDTGTGIEPALLSRVFDLFVQGDQSLDRTQGGLGIGLTLVKNLVGLHGGSVEVQSRGRNQGSEFIVRLPLSEGPLRLPQSRRPYEGQIEAAPPFSILIIDDNRDAAQTLAQLIRLWGYQVSVCYDGESGLAKATQETPDVVLLDIGLPDIDGYEVARRMRASLPRLPYLIALSGYGQAEDRERAVQSGFHRHFTKPLDGAVLEQLFAELAAERAGLSSK